ncbi:MAG: GEVED domain-containing protein, partial [Weeksellaceae bacterium]
MRNCLFSLGALLTGFSLFFGLGTANAQNFTAEELLEIQANQQIQAVMKISNPFEPMFNNFDYGTEGTMANWIPVAGATETFAPAVGDHFFDPGGPGGGADGSAGNYPNCNCDTQTTLTGVSQIKVIDMDIFANFDYLRIYDGTSTSGTLLYGNGAGDPDDGDYGLPSGTILNAASGNFFFFFHASSVVNRLGWDIEIMETGGGGSDYCIPAGTNSNYYINDFFTTGADTNITNMGSGFSPGGYGDFYSTHGVSAAVGDSFDFTANFPTGQTYGFRIWVDWNQDGVFDTTEEVAYHSTSYQNTQIGTVTVPSTALSGDTRMRIVGHWLNNQGDIDPCSTTHNYGEFEDYKFTVTGGGGGPFPDPYCEVTFPSDVEPISRVIFGDIDNSSDPTVNGSPAHEDFTAISTDIEQGSSNPIAVEGNTNGAFTTYVTVYIDYDQSGTFEESERTNIGTIYNSTGTDGVQATGNISVPSGATAGPTRMRVLKKWGGYVTDACNTSGFGQAEDYTVNITEAGGGGSGSDCLTTLFASNNGGSPGWTQMFDVGIKGSDISITEISVNTSAATGTTVSMDVYTLEGSYLGNETNPGAWTLSATGTGTSMGQDNPTPITLDTPLNLSATTNYGIAIVLDASSRYTNGTGANQHFENDQLTMDLGSSISGLFTGTLFANRVFNGTLCYDYGSGGGTGSECDFGIPSFSDLTNAYNIDLSNAFRTADDFILTEDFAMDKITIDTNQQQIPDDVVIYIHEDNAGKPGTVIHTLTFAGPDTSEVVGSAFGDPIHHMTFNVSPAIDFAPGTYWIDPKMSTPSGETVWWGATDLASYGALPQRSTDDGITWNEDANGLNMIFTVSGFCGDGPVSGDCPIEYEGDFIDGLGNLATGIILAADFPVPSGETWNLGDVKVQLLYETTNVEISFYQDGGGQPGTQIFAPTVVTPVGQEIVGNASGTDVYEVTLDMSSYNISLTGGMYWMGITTTAPGGASYWHYTESVNNGTNFFGSLDGYATWEDVGNFGFFVDGAFSICTSSTPPPGGDCEQDFYTTEDPISGAGFSSGNWVANDVIVAGDSQFTMQTMTFETVTLSGNPTNFDLEIFEDDGSGGVGASTGMTYHFDSSNMTYTPNGLLFGVYPQYTVVFDL